MTFLAHIGTWFAIPFIAFSAWFGGGAHMHQWPVQPPVATSTPPTSTSTPPTHIPPPVVQTGVTIYSVSPTGAHSIGTTVAVTGFSFTSDNTILLDGMVAARNVPIKSSIAVACTTDPSCIGGIRQTLTFTVPSSIGPDCKPTQACPMYMRLLTNGTYDLTVENENGVSKPVSVTIVGAASIQ